MKKGSSKILNGSLTTSGKEDFTDIEMVALMKGNDDREESFLTQAGLLKSNGFNKSKQKNLETSSEKEMGDSEEKLTKFNDEKKPILNTEERQIKFSPNLRLIEKSGKDDFDFLHVTEKSNRYYSDLFTSFIDAQWRWILFLFSLSFLTSWVSFGSLWWLVMVIRERTGSTAVCIDNVDSWTGAFLFSVETQTTIGYGGRQVTPECPEGVILLLVQTLVGLLINCSTLGLLFAKISRPKNRAQTVIFSKQSVVTLFDSKLCFMFRLADIRKRKLFDCNLRAVLIHHKVTQEGEYYPYFVSDLKLTIDQMQQEYTLRVFPFIPQTIMHVIDDESPLYEVSYNQFLQRHYEIVIILEGTVPNTGMVTQGITSYLSSEIRWGHKFLTLIDRKTTHRDLWKIDFDYFDEVYKDSKTPTCSARDLEQEEERESNGYQSGQSTSSTNSFSVNMPSDNVIIDIETNHCSLSQDA